MIGLVINSLSGQRRTFILGVNPINEIELKKGHVVVNESIKYLQLLHNLHDNWMEKKGNYSCIYDYALRNFKDPEVMKEIFEELSEFLHSLD